MNREQAEKLLAALIFNDLDETSKAELTAYLQTDDELRYRLADLRMAVKLTDDAVNEGPDPVLGEQRLKQLKRLAKADKAKMRIFRNVRLLAVAAVLMFAFLLVGISTFSLSSRRMLSPRMSKTPQYYDYAREPASRPASRGAPSGAAPPAIRNSTMATPSGGSGVSNMLLNPPEGRAGYMAGTGGMGMEGRASDRKDYYGTGMMGGIGANGRDMLGKEVATASKASELNRDMYAGAKVSEKQPAAADERWSWPKDMPDRLVAGIPVTVSPRDGSAPPAQRRQVAKDLAGKPIAMESESAMRFGRGVSDKEADYGGGVYQSSRGNRAAELPARADVRHIDGAVGNGVVNIDGAAYPDNAVNYAWSGTVTPQRPAEPMSTPAPSAPVAVDVKKSDDVLDFIARGNRVPILGDVPLVGDLSQKGVQPKANAEALSQAIGGATVSADVSSVQVQKEPLVLGTVLEDFAAEAKAKAEPDPAASLARTPGESDIAYRTRVAQVRNQQAALRAQQQIARAQLGQETKPGAYLDADSLTKLKVEQNTPSLGVVSLRTALADQDGDGVPPSSHFKVVPVNPWVLTEQDALSTFGLDVDTASYALCQRYIRGGYLPPVGAVRMEEFINAFDYAYPQRDDQPFTVYAEGAPAPFAPAGQDLSLLKVAVKARNVGRDQRRAAHLVFVVDASASMGQADRLPLVQSVANQLVDKLSEGDRVSLITCANDARLHLDTVSARQKDTIRETINAIQPAGPTNLLAGLKLGYEMARKNFVAGQTNQVVLCSDGVANVGQTEAEAMLQEVAQDRKQAITLTCVGVGYGAYNDAFLEALANQGDGRYVFLDSSEQAQEALVGQLAASLENVASDARIQVQFNPNRVRRYRLIGYEDRDIEDKRFRDDTVDAGAVGSGQCSTALYELELTTSRGEGVPPSNRGQDARDTDGTDLGTVFVRYRNAETGQMEEISRPLADSIVRRRSVEEDPRLFLAAGVARFAEWLRQSEHAQNTALPDVQRLLDQVSAALPLDRDVQELAALAHQAEGLPRAPEAAPAPETQK